MRRYHIECERNTAGLFIGWSVHNTQHPPVARIYPLYEMAESEAVRLEMEISRQEAATEQTLAAAILAQHRHQTE